MTDTETDDQAQRRRQGERRPMPKPTKCMPGTLGKIHVLMLRVERGQQLWHPLDAQWPDAELDLPIRMLSW